MFYQITKNEKHTIKKKKKKKKKEKNLEQLIVQGVKILLIMLGLKK